MSNQEIVKAKLQAMFDISLENFDDVLFKVMYKLKHEIDDGATVDDLRQKYDSSWWDIDITNDNYPQLRLVPEVFM